MSDLTEDWAEIVPTEPPAPPGVPVSTLQSLAEAWEEEGADGWYVLVEQHQRIVLIRGIILRKICTNYFRFHVQEVLWASGPTPIQPGDAIPAYGGTASRNLQATLKKIQEKVREDVQHLSTEVRALERSRAKIEHELLQVRDSLARAQEEEQQALASLTAKFG